MKLDLSCRDWQTRIRALKSIIPDGACGINSDESACALTLFNKMRLPDVPGMPFLEDAAGEWFKDFVATFLGAVDPVTGARLIRESFVLVPKKNSKTSYGAAMMLTALIMNKRPRAEFLFIGPTQAVADLAFEQAAGMIENDPDGFLQKTMHVRGHLKTIIDRRTKAELKIKTFDASVLTGVKPVGVLLDELHEISKNARASKIIGQLRGGLIANPEGFLCYISTQSDDAPAGIFKAELQHARAIRDGRSTGSTMPILYEFPPDIVADRGYPPAWQKPENWPMVLPNAGRSITIPRLVDELAAAIDKGEDELRRWASQHLNIEIGVGLMSDAWVGAEYWQACAVPTLTLDAILGRSEVVVVGIDGGGMDDLLGLAVLGRDMRTREWLLWTHAWCHATVLNRRKEIAPRLLDFQAAGDLTICERIGQDVIEVADLIQQIDESGTLPAKNAIGVDQVGISDIVDELQARGIDVERIIGVQQGWKLNNAILTVERKLAAKALQHDGSAMMSWCVGNAKVEARGSAISITKQAAGRAKIDPVMALFDAVMMLALNRESTTSVYDLEAETNVFA